MKNAAKKIIDNLPAMKKTFEQISSQAVMVGVPGDTTNRKSGGINNASLAFIHDQGSPAANIPARPFMKPGIKDAKAKIVSAFKLAGEKALRKDDAAIEKGLHRAGLIATSAIKARINSGISPTLAEGTLAGRRRRGRTGTVPLIDTGQLRNSISYVLVKK